MRTEIQRLVHLHILVGHSVGVQSHQVSVNNMFGYCSWFFLNRVSLIPHLPTISILKSKNPCWPIPLILFFFFQNVALPPLAAPARTWESETVNMNTLATTAAAASAQIHLGSALLVSLIQPLEKESGSNNFAL